MYVLRVTVSCCLVRPCAARPNPVLWPADPGSSLPPTGGAGGNGFPDPYSPFRIPLRLRLPSAARLERGFSNPFHRSSPRPPRCPYTDLLSCCPSLRPNYVPPPT